MVVPTGTASPWSELSSVPATRDSVVYFRDGWVTGSADMLAEAVRADGIIRTLGIALRAVEDAELQLGWYGYVDGREDEILCDSDGETEDGDVVDEPRPCVFATVNIRE